MVVTLRWLPTADTGVTQARTALPSRWTVQAPHCAIPQPNLVPVKPRTSRRTQSSGMSGGASTSRSWPLTTSFIGAALPGPKGGSLGREKPLPPVKNAPSRASARKLRRCGWRRAGQGGRRPSRPQCGRRESRTAGPGRSIGSPRARQRNPWQTCQEVEPPRASRSADSRAAVGGHRPGTGPGAYLRRGAGRGDAARPDRRDRDRQRDLSTRGSSDRRSDLDSPLARLLYAVAIAACWR